MRAANLERPNRLEVLRLEPGRVVPGEQRRAQGHAPDAIRRLADALQGDEGGVFVEAHWCGDAACEARVKEETKATIRNIPFDAPAEQGRCIVDGKPGIGKRVVFAKAY